MPHGIKQPGSSTLFMPSARAQTASMQARLLELELWTSPASMMKGASSNIRTFRPLYSSIPG